MDNSGNGFENFNRGNNNGVNKPLDISSELWTPISVSRKNVGEDETNNLKNLRPENREKNKTPPASSNSHNKKKVQHSKPGKTSGQNKPKTSNNKNAQTGKRNTNENIYKPISEMGKKRQNIQQTQSRKNTVPRQKQKPLDWSEDKYKNEIKAGRSRDEISRKNARRKKKKRKKVAIITVVALLIFAVSFAFIFCYAKGAPIATIVVEGDSVYSEKKIIEASGINVGDNMLTIREKRISSIVSQKLPYVASVKVDYQLPDTLRLEVSPTTETILITNNNGYICLDPTYKIVSLKKKKLIEGKFRIDGLETQKVESGTIFEPNEKNSKKFNKAVEIIKIINSVGLTNANIINVGDLGNIYITFDSRINIFVGDGSQLETKLKNSQKIISDSFGAKQIGYIDASYDNVAYAFDGKMFPD